MTPFTNPERFVIEYPTEKNSLSRSLSELTERPNAVEAITSFAYLEENN